MSFNAQPCLCKCHPCSIRVSLLQALLNSSFWAPFSWFLVSSDKQEKDCSYIWSGASCYHCPLCFHVTVPSDRSQVPSCASPRANLEWGDKDSLTGSQEELCMAKKMLSGFVASFEKACEQAPGVSHTQFVWIPARSKDHFFRCLTCLGVYCVISVCNVWGQSKIVRGH